MEARILDAGCGDGSFVKFLRELGYRNAEGFDASTQKVEQARRSGVEGVGVADLRTYFRQCGRRDWWDAIFLLNVLEHLKKAEVLQALRDVCHALKPGGVLWVRVPNGAGLFGGYTRYIEFTHEMAFTTNSLGEVLRFAGFSRVRFYPWGPVPHGTVSLARWVGWKAVEMTLKVVSLLETASQKGGIFTADLLAEARKAGQWSVS